jgi:hypothetical protein
MNSPEALYSVPDQIEPNLRHIKAYWDGLKRGENNIPFADDLNLEALSGYATCLTVIDAFDEPIRFRFAITGKTVATRYGSDMDGRFLDEMVERDPIDQINAQCHVTASRGVPTYFRSATPSAAAPGTRGAYARLLLPLWGEGFSRMLLGGIAPA